MRVHYAILAATALVAGLADAATRTWSSANGKFTIEAEMVTVKDEKVELRKANGDLIEVPLEKLSDGRPAIRQRELCPVGRRQNRRARGLGRRSGELHAGIETAGRVEGSGGVGRGCMARLCSPQTFFMDVGGRGLPSGDDADAFRRVVKREPRGYVAARPFRGVARLGSREYGFVLDASSPAVPGYDRLYFDLNGNGDLTDDRVIAGVISGTPQVNTAAFPRVDLPIEVDGSRQDYSFFFKALCSSLGGYASASLTPAVYREGKMLLGGKKCHVVLLDSNSNGRFSDESRVPSMTGVPQIVPGDMLLFERGTRQAVARRRRRGPVLRGQGNLRRRTILRVPDSAPGRQTDAQALGHRLGLCDKPQSGLQRGDLQRGGHGAEHQRRQDADRLAGRIVAAGLLHHGPVRADEIRPGDEIAQG